MFWTDFLRCGTYEIVISGDNGSELFTHPVIANLKPLFDVLAIPDISKQMGMQIIL